MNKRRRYKQKRRRVVAKLNRIIVESPTYSERRNAFLRLAVMGEAYVYLYGDPARGKAFAA